ncbi:PAS domain S-box-containing protein [Saonia flava]|uniref:histidine kinase n=1 Tax=Saonia flava TaxID=523696 RepID=A0A846QTS3_9FLAO|nr:PAS domain S-box protein [Saonia flava]NJB71448.1 PAS domain S-box-containing protein [Saonia flava]
MKLLKNITFFKNPILFGILVFSLVLLLTQIITSQQYLLFKSIEQDKIDRQAVLIEEGLQDVMRQHFTSTQTLAFIVEQYGVPSNFDSISKILLNTNKHVDALELVNSEGTITHVYPYKDNEVVGFNILKDSLGKKGAIATIERKDFFIAGPLKLKQGGSGFISRTPIFNSKGAFKGFTSSVLKLSTLLKAAHLDSLSSSPFSYCLAKINADKSEEVFFSYGSASTKKNISIPIKFNQAEFVLYVISNNRVTFLTVFAFILLGFIISLLAGFFTWHLARQPRKLNRMVKEKTTLLYESEEKFRTLVEQASDGIFISDLKGNLIDVNIRGTKMFNYSKEELLNLGIKDIIVSKDLKTNPLKLKELVQGEIILSERKMLRKDGSTFFGEINAKMLPNSTFQGIIRDITERKELEIALKSNLDKFSKAFNSGTVGMVIFNQDKQVADINDFLLNLLGRSRNEVVGKTFTEIGFLKDNDSILREKVLQEVKNKGKVSQMDVALNTKKGDLLHFIFSAEPYQIDKAVYVLSTFIDQTEAKKAQKKVEESEEKFSKAFHNNLMGVLIMDSERKIIEVNNRVTKVLGVTRDKMLGKTITESGALKLKPNNTDQRNNLLKKLQKKGQIINEEVTYTLNTGKKISALISVEPFIFDDSQNFLVTIMDNTSRKEAEDKLEAQNLELKKTNSELDRFVYSASHELRAPLTSVMGLIHITLMEEDKPELIEKLNMMGNSLKRLDNFIKDIIQYSRNSHLKVNLEKINFENLIKESLENLWYLENRSDIQIETNLNDSVDFVSDKKRISVLLDNFISNAIKYHNIEQPNPTIWIKIKTSKTKAIIEIHDNGPGIPDEHLDKIFNMFYRVSSKIMGTGIGLFIVKEIVDKLNGSIKVESKPDDGTKFIITLPNQQKKLNTYEAKKNSINR